MTSPSEQDRFHTRILRLTLAVEEARAYWMNAQEGEPSAPRLERAFQERWFGTKSHARVRLLLVNFTARFDAFPPALPVLRRWNPQDVVTRRLVCHWHLQLSDPLYRDFTGAFLPERRSLGHPVVDRDLVIRWMADRYPTQWAAATRASFATKLLHTAREAGLLDRGSKGRRSLLVPSVPDEALTYFLRLSQRVRLSEPLLDNPYLRSVGLGTNALDARLQRLPDLDFRRMGTLTELAWNDDPSRSWPEEVAR